MGKNIWSVKAIRSGGIILDRSAMTHFKGKGETLDVPIWFLAATDGKHKVLVDTGIFNLAWVQAGPEPGCHQSPDQVTPAAVKKHMGWEADEVEMIVNTHLHYDHCGGNQYFQNAECYVQRTEWQAAFNPIESEKIFYSQELFGKGAINYFQWRFLEGETTILPGLMVIPTPGHTRGHQSVLINTAQGVLCVAGDSVNTAENINGNMEPNIVVNTQQVYESLKLIRQCASFVLPGHEPSIPDGETRNFSRIESLK